MRKYILLIIFFIIQSIAYSQVVVTNSLTTLIEIKHLELISYDYLKDGVVIRGYSFNYIDHHNKHHNMILATNKDMGQFVSSLTSFVDSSLKYRGEKVFHCDCSSKCAIAFEPQLKTYYIVFEKQFGQIDIIDSDKIAYNYSEIKGLLNILQSLIN